MTHQLVSAYPGKPGGFRSGNVGEYKCKCGEVLPGNESFKKHRATALRAEAVERVANVLKKETASETGGYWYWEDYVDLAKKVLDAAKPVRG